MAFDRSRTARLQFLKMTGSASALALACVASPALAQDTAAPEAQTAAPDSAPDASDGAEILVTGIRASLAKAQDIKRDSDTIVDAITAEDIGALPDRSVNEALQRIPGVAITRYASAEDSQHFSVEGSGVVIRGLSYVKGEFNGRDTFSTSGGREISFNDVAPELVGSVEVFKNLTPDMIEGGISGTVNINTRKPFDSREQLIYLSGEINYGDLTHRSAPTLTGLYSNQWELSGGERIGFLVSATYSRLYSKVDSAFVASPFERFNGTRTFNEGSPYESTVTDTFNCGGTLTSCYAPTGAGVRTQDFDRKRVGISAAAQFATAGDSVIATAQFLRTNGRNSWTEHTIEPNVWYPDVNATFPAPGTSYEFDDDGVFVNGSITRPGGLHEGWIPGPGGLNPDGSRRYGVLTNFQAGGIFTTFSNRGFITDYTTDDYSLNFKVRASDRLHFNFDAQYVRAKAKEWDVIVDTATFSNISLDVSGNIPQVGFDIGNVPDYGRAPSAGEYFANPNSIYFRDAFTDIDDNDGEEWALRGDADYQLSDTGLFRKIRAGVRYSDRDQTVRNNNYNNWGAPSETWTNGGAQTFATLDPSTYELFQFDNFFRGAVDQPPGAVYLRGNIAENYDRTQDLLRQITAAGQGNYVPIEDRACATVNTYFCPNEVYVNSERTWAGYARLDFSTDDGDGGPFLDGNIGVRYVNTLDVAQGALTAPTPNSVFNPGINPDTGVTYTLAQYCALTTHQTIPAICRLSPTQAASAIAFANGASYAYPARNQYDHWLPSLNLRFKASDQLQFRFAASRAISRPNFGNLRAYIGVNASSNTAGELVFTSNSQNPYLRPVEATQFDLTGEWYFSRVGSLTGAVFYKKLKNYIDLNGQGVIDVSNNGETFPVVLNGPINREGSADIKGFEVAYQQTFDFLPGALSGLGLQATYTYTDPGKIPNGTPTNGAGDGSRPPGEVNNLYDNLPLTQLSKHNVNVAGFFDKGGFYARLAYSWRSRYLLSVRDCCFPFLPVYSEATGQLDGSLFYTVNDHFKIGVQGSNLLNEVTRTSFALYENDEGDLVTSKRAAFINDRRFSVSVRLSY